MTRYKPHANKDYVLLATKIGFNQAVDELKKDIILRNKHFYLRAAARKLKMDAAALFRYANRFGIKFTRWNQIMAWHEVLGQDMSPHESYLAQRKSPRD